MRNALVRANYENVRLQIEKTQLPLEEFFKVLLFGYEIELKNRYLRVGCEYGSQHAEEIKDLHRRNDDTDVVTKSSDVVIKPSDVVINNVVKRADVIIKFTPIEEKAINILLRNPKISASQLGDQLGVVLRQAQRVMDSLKKKAGLKRRGARKNGEWYFEK